MSGRIMRRTTTFRAYSTPECLNTQRRAFRSKWYGDEDGAATERGLDPEEQAAIDEDLYKKYAPTDNHNGQDPSYPRRGLPISPLMNPKYQAAKGKCHQPKSQPPKILTPFQNRLAKNPYAQALASPVRMCALTRIRLPSFFQIPFELLRHPDTQEAWYLPRSLYPIDSPASIVTAEAIEAAAATRSDRRGPRTWLLSRQALLSATLTPKSGFTRGWEKFLPPHVEQWRTAPSAKRVRWRDDIDGFVLGLLRRRLVLGLRELAERRKGYLSACKEGWASLRGMKQLGAVLWLGLGGDVGAAKVRPSRGEQEENLTEGDQEVRREAKDDLEKPERYVGPGEFATVEKKEGWRTNLPVYNLQALLGEDHVEELRAFNPDIFGGELAVIKHRGMTMDTELQLWKLQGYIAKHEDVV